MDKKDPRSEFNKFRRKLLKEHNIEHLICARCGEWRCSVHLHHIKEIVYGGDNKIENLIPLCCRCHGEWDCWNDGEFDFGTFLLTPPISAIKKVFFGKMAMSKHSLMTFRAMLPPLYSAVWAEMYHDGEDCGQYMGELFRQNEIFNAYPYSDTFKMFELYGDINTPVVLEDDTALDNLISRLVSTGQEEAI